MGRRTTMDLRPPIFVFLSIFLSVLMCAPAAAQSGGTAGSPPDGRDGAVLPWYLQFEDPGPFEALLTWYPPLFIKNGIDLKDFIRSETFAAIRRREGDRKAADAIFVRAMTLTRNNTSAALLICTVATLDHYVVGVKIPLLNFFLPLSNESREDFDARVRNLPGRIYSDSPADGPGGPGAGGDRDKLQHFFGSAYVAFTFESQGAADRVGEFVEIGEDAMIVDGVLDNRDRRANWNGTQFGTALLANNRRYPSDFFRAPVAAGDRPGDGHIDNTGCR